MKKKKIKIFIIISVIVAILATIGVIGVFQYRKITLEKYNTDIQEQLTNLSHLENEVYFNHDYKKDISDIESESKIAFENKQLSKLSEVRNQATDLYDKISAEIDKYNKYYTLLTETVENSNNLKKNYFSKTYDTSKLDTTKDKAEKAISESEYTQYEELYNTLSEQNTILETNIQKSLSEIYNKVTDEENFDFPFAVKEAEIPAQLSFKPLVKQTESYPTWVTSRDSEVLNEPPVACLFIGGSSAEYNYTIKQIPTKEIAVQDENRELQKVLVNTQITFKVLEKFSWENKVSLNERPAYFFKDKKDQIYLALKDYEGGEYYILYLPGQ